MLYAAADADTMVVSTRRRIDFLLVLIEKKVKKFDEENELLGLMQIFLGVEEISLLIF